MRLPVRLVPASTEPITFTLTRSLMRLLCRTLLRPTMLPVPPLPLPLRCRLIHRLRQLTGTRACRSSMLRRQGRFSSRRQRQQRMRVILDTLQPVISQPILLIHCQLALTIQMAPTILFLSSNNNNNNKCKCKCLPFNLLINRPISNSSRAIEINDPMQCKTMKSKVMQNNEN